MRFLPFILILVVTIYALIDCIRYEEEPLPGGVPKPLWVVLILVLQPIAGIAWLVVSRINPEAGAAARPGSRPPRRPARPARPMAPDDDPEFLASLDRDVPRGTRPGEGTAGAEAGDDAAEHDEDTDDEGRPSRD